MSLYLVVSEQSLIIILNAYQAPSVILSASSNITILCQLSSKTTFFFAKALISSLTTSIPLSSEAFFSNTACLYESLSNYLAKHNTELVFPIPGGPTKIILGIFPSSAILLNFNTESSFPSTSSRVLGLYLFKLIKFIPQI